MAAEDCVIIADKLVKTFGRVVAVNNIDLRVKRGEIFGLLGPNGAGKTTTIRLITGVLRPTSGTVLVYGYRIPRERKKALMVMGYVPQRFSLYEDLTVYENLDLFASFYGMKRDERRVRINDLLDRFLLHEYRNMLAGHLSGGTKQRLALAAALIHEPKLLILDEPTAGMDPNLRRVFWNYFKELNREGTTILVTTHYMDEAERCDRLALIREGKIIAEGSPRQVKRLAFGGDLVRVTVKNPFSPSILSSLPYVKSAIEESRSDGYLTLKLVLNNAEMDLISLVKELERHGYHVKAATIENVSLEEAFIRMAGDSREGVSSRKEGA